MKLNIPENISEITVWQYQLYCDLIKEKEDKNSIDFITKKINIFCNENIKSFSEYSFFDLHRISNQIDKALLENVEFKNTMSIDRINYGFIPDFDKITMGEYIDLCNYSSSVEDLNKFMAVLFRPILNKKGNLYEILPYDGTEKYSALMLKCPLNIAFGANVFFCNLMRELEIYMKNCLNQELLRGIKQKNISKISVGLFQLKNWLKTTF